MRDSCRVGGMGSGRLCGSGARGKPFEVIFTSTFQNAFSPKRTLYMTSAATVQQPEETLTGPVAARLFGLCWGFVRDIGGLGHMLIS